MISTARLARLVFSDGFKGAIIPRERADKWKEEYGERHNVTIEDVPSCACCGHPWNYQYDGTEYRCSKHYERNPCAIEGCTRTTDATGRRKRSDSYLCSTHWRLYCPPRSKRRRAYHAFFRKAKRDGWHDDLHQQFIRFWNQLVATARAKAEGGSINKAEIDRMFGW